MKYRSESLYKIWVIPHQVNTHTHAHARTHARMHAHAHAHTHTHTHTQKKTRFSRISTNHGFYIVFLETFTHTQFQHYILYDFRVTASHKSSCMLAHSACFFFSGLHKNEREFFELQGLKIVGHKLIMLKAMVKHQGISQNLAKN